MRGMAIQCMRSEKKEYQYYTKIAVNSNNSSLLDNNFTKASYLCIADKVREHFCQWDKGHRILYTFFNMGQNAASSNFANESRW